MHACTHTHICQLAELLLRWMGWGGMDCIDLPQERTWQALVNAVMNLWVS